MIMPPARVKTEEMTEDIRVVMGEIIAVTFVLILVSKSPLWMPSKKASRSKKDERASG